MTAASGSAATDDLHHCDFNERPSISSRTAVESKSIVVVVRRRLQLRYDFDCNSTALRPFDDLRYDRRATCCGFMHCGLNSSSSSSSTLFAK